MNLKTIIDNLLFKKQFMCDLTNQSRDSYYENIKGAVYNKLNQNEEQLEAIEEYFLFK